MLVVDGCMGISSVVMTSAIYLWYASTYLAATIGDQFNVGIRTVKLKVRERYIIWYYNIISHVL